MEVATTSALLEFIGAVSLLLLIIWTLTEVVYFFNTKELDINTSRVTLSFALAYLMLFFLGAAVYTFTYTPSEIEEEQISNFAAMYCTLSLFAWVIPFVVFISSGDNRQSVELVSDSNSSVKERDSIEPETNTEVSEIFMEICAKCGEKFNPHIIARGVGKAIGGGIFATSFVFMMTGGLAGLVVLFAPALAGAHLMESSKSPTRCAKCRVN